MARLGCKSLAEFRAVSPEKLFEAWQSGKKEIKGGMMSTTPVKDGHFIVEGSKPKKIPYIIGVNSHDMAPPILYSMGKKWGEKNSVTTYGYHLARMLPGDKNGSWHSADLWYWFGTLPNCWRPMEQRDYEISEQMTDYLCAFAKGGKPSGDPEWESCERGGKVMLFGDKTTEMGKPSMLKLIGIMLTNKAVGE
jgi:para-nitrobenzyl esterase